MWRLNFKDRSWIDGGTGLAMYYVADSNFSGRTTSQFTREGEHVRLVVAARVEPESQGKGEGHLYLETFRTGSTRTLVRGLMELTESRLKPRKFSQASVGGIVRQRVRTNNWAS